MSVMTGQTWPAVIVDGHRVVQVVGTSLLPPGRYAVTDLDWREIFRRYVEVVGEAEGVDFLHREGWSEEEWAAFHQLWPDDARFAPTGGDNQ